MLCNNAGMPTPDFLSNQLLIAMPGMADPNFNSTVTLVCEHNSDGAIGVVINRPMEFDLSNLYAQLQVEGSTPIVERKPVLSGGPVAPERGFVLHNSDRDYESSLDVAPRLRLTMSRDVIDDMARGDGPEKTLVALGIASWGAGQLDEEILSNTWLTVPATADIVFDVPFADRWRVAAMTIGVDISQISADAGHA